MLKTGILNPSINSLLSRVRHTNTLLKAIRGNFSIGRAFMAEEFRAANSAETCLDFEAALSAIPLVFEPHIEFKKRVPKAIGLIRSADTIQYANMILESA
jgi:D-ribose pyranase